MSDCAAKAGFTRHAAYEKRCWRLHQKMIDKPSR